MSETLTITALAGKGDGLAESNGRPVFVPFTLPGETVEAVREGDRGRVVSIIEPSAERRGAPCPHFGECGGCDLQHASEPLYADFKRDLVVGALRQKGIAAEVEPLDPCPPASRRRAVFTARRAGPRVVFGFHEAGSHRIASIETCLVVVPEIEARLPLLRKLASLAIDRRRPLRLTATWTASGLDVALADAAPLKDDLRQALVTLALANRLARLSLGDEVLIEAQKPVIDVDGVPVTPAPGGFLQAVAASEAAMARLVTDHLAGCKSVADLFCGIGTFALRLARHSAVHAVESEAPALAALDQAVRGARGLKPVTSERRDLFRRPLTAKELARFEGLVFDPPRAGAEAQAGELARSHLRKIAAVSCNPVTLARDARLLLDGGFRLVRVVPVDQFLWSYHTEVVALFER
ncbi:class I SAM-dependent RNA methyltransferase [Mangrovibrevibacter kandeliae]|uniref:class I SAM-dependent RNA methyltransferase n=1 Tax=Mangrovibrevibacter kandeliae TaxID=2968473 RepID=UPI002119707A|nr:class I SAM-dependent RNA methyltransferase [Aurantimonas sp. CSK15Z-1]